MRAFVTGADEELEGDFSKAGARHMSRAPPGEAVSVEHEETRKGNAVRSGDLEDFVEHRVVKKVLYEQERHLQAEIERVRNEMPTTTTLTSKQQGLQHVDAAGHGHVMESGSSRTPGVPLDTVGLQTSLESWSRVQAPAATSLPAFGAPPHVVASSPTNLSPREPWHSLEARVRLTTDEARETFEAIDKNHDEELSQIEYIQALRKNPKIAKRLGLPNAMRQEDESRRLFQTALGAIDTTDQSKTISWREFVAFYCPEFEARSQPGKDKVSTSTPSFPASGASGGGRDGRAAPGMLNVRLEQLEDRLRLLDTPPPKVQKMGTDTLWTIEMQLAELEKEDTRQRGDRKGAAKRELLLQRKHQEVQEREEEDARLQRLRQKGYSGVPPQWADPRADQRPYLTRASSTLQEREEEDARLQRPYLTRASSTLLALSTRSLRDVTSHVTTLSADLTTSSANSIPYTTNTKRSGMRKRERDGHRRRGDRQRHRHRQRQTKRRRKRQRQGVLPVLRDGISLNIQIPSTSSIFSCFHRTRTLSLARKRFNNSPYRFQNLSLAHTPCVGFTQDNS